MDKPPVQRRGEDPPVRPGLGRGGHDGSLGGMGLVEVEDNGRGLEHHQGEHPRGCESCKRGVAGPATVQCWLMAEYSYVRQSDGFRFKLSS